MVTVTYNGETVWPEFFDSMLAQLGVEWHLIVVDNASTDRTTDMVRAAQDARITLIANDRNAGVAEGNNQGTQWALDHGYDEILLINNDTAFGPDLLQRLSATLEQSGAGAVSALIPYYDQPDISWYSGGHFSKPRGMLSLHDGQGKLFSVGDAPFPTDYAPTCCVLFRAEVFKRVGLMDETYFVYWDDVDFLWRMKRAGIKIVVDPAAVMLHKVSISTGGRQSDFSIRYGHRNQIYFARKFFGPVYAAYVTVFSTSTGLGRVVLGKDSGRQWRLRLKAMSEGWKMQLPAHAGA
ncbi:hypothetical protein ASE70_17070 [Sphingomonas sp. Leaf22]|nr:hypothetical protein ASE70_17070 [Sphingomonas sp. Leaf22]